jgi:DNA-binding MarR family transcriptional regulator
MNSSPSAVDARDPRLEAWRTFLHAHHRVRSLLEAELEAEQQMPLGEYEVLLLLAYADERRMRMSELADQLLLSRSGVTRLIDRLESHGTVRRGSCQEDRRGSWAILTDAGHERLRAASPTHLRGIGEHFLDRIPARELEALQRTLSRVLADPAPRP